MFARARIGAKLPSDDPNSPDEAAPHIDLAPLPGIGAVDEFRICTDPSDFMFTIKRRILGAGSWTDIMKLNAGSDPVAWQFGASFLPTAHNTYDFGNDALRWRDVFLHRYLAIFGFTSNLPTPNLQVMNRVTARTPATAATELYFCRRRTAADYKWFNITDNFEVTAILKDVTGITKSTIGQTAVEILGAAHRTKVDLTYMDRCRVVFGGQNNEAATFYCKIQFSIDGDDWFDLTSEAASDGTDNEQLVVGAWGNVPMDALSDVYVRAVGRAANDTSNPTYKSIELQMR